MGLCKCRVVTTLFCFQHRINVCEQCLVRDHPTVRCVIGCVMPAAVTHSAAVSMDDCTPSVHVSYSYNTFITVHRQNVCEVAGGLGFRPVLPAVPRPPGQRRSHHPLCLSWYACEMSGCLVFDALQTLCTGTVSRLTPTHCPSTPLQPATPALSAVYVMTSCAHMSACSTQPGAGRPAQQPQLPSCRGCQGITANCAVVWPHLTISPGPSTGERAHVAND